MSKSVAFIPARGGSKGIPRKNVVEIKGKPLIAYSIMAALESNIDEVWVSSEDDEILQVSREFGAKTIRRPAEIAQDESSSEEALMHFAANVDFEIIAFIQATSPLISSNDINRSLTLIESCDSVVAVTENNQFVWIGIEPQYDINSRKRRQDLEQSYLETGSLFVTTRESLLASKNRLSGQIKLLTIPKIRSFDIDTPEDLEVVKRLL